MPHPSRGWSPTGTSLFAELLQRHPSRFAEGQRRTLQRRVRAWRAQRILVFDEQWLHDDVLVTHRLPRPLRVLPADQTDELALAALR